MFPRDRVISSLVKYSIPFAEGDATEELRTKLARFYADRTITKDPITPADQAEAFFLLVSGRLSKTTGQVIHVTADWTPRFCGNTKTGGTDLRAQN